MRILLVGGLLLSLITSSIFAQTKASSPTSQGARLPGSTRPHDTPYAITNRTENSRVWERTTYERRRDGVWVPHVHRYEEVATGMHYKDRKGNLVESKEEIVPAPGGGAQAVEGQHSAYFPYDIYDGAIELTTENGEHLKSRPIGISFFDGTNSVLIAELTNSIGRIISPNQIIYTNAFTDFPADLLVTYRISGLECDLVFRSKIPSPEAFGLSVSSARLELLTEFFGATKPHEKESALNPVTRLSDSTLEFGSMTMIQGKAFRVGNRGSGLTGAGERLSVAKTWIPDLGGRTVLVEELRYQDIKPSLESLPSAASVKPPTTASANAALHRISGARLLPPARVALASTNVVQFAKADPEVEPGLVLDYNIVNSQTNVTFRGDTTYYVSNSVNLAGTTVIEGGTVIKYDTNFTCVLNILGNLQCQTAPYHPAILTSVNDTTVGEGINSSGHSPCEGTFYLTVVNDVSQYLDVYVYDDNGNFLVSGYPIPPESTEVFTMTVGLGQHLAFESFDDDLNESYLDFWPTLQNGLMEVFSDESVSYSEGDDYICTGSGFSSTGLSLANGGSLHDLSFRYLGVGIQSSANYSVTNLQFVQCQNSAFDTENASLYAGNVLISQSPVAFGGHNFNVTAEQLTYDQGIDVAYDSAVGDSSLSLTNALITAVSTFGNTVLATNHVWDLASGSGVYQTMGSGSYYLGNNSLSLVGTPDIDPALLAQLEQKTTYPPKIFTGITITTNVEFGPNVLRDTNGPTVGYHYAPLDYCFGRVTANSNVTFDAGTAVGWFELYGGNDWGIALNNHSTNRFNGTVTAPCVFARYDTVQEGNGTWPSHGWLGGVTTLGNSSYFAEIDAQFLRCYAFAADPNHFRDYYAQLNLHANECEFYDGDLGGYWFGQFMTNCLFDREPQVGTDQRSAGIYWRNCTMHGGGVYALHDWGGTNLYWHVWIENCAFDGSSILMSDYSAGNTNITYCNYNAFLNGAHRLIVNGSNDVVVTNAFTWQTGPLGNYYQPPTTLVDKGSVTADIVGLYEYTTQTNQLKESNSVVDIGYHYVATDANGNPLETYTNGIPDYIVDTAGNGMDTNGLPFWWELQYFGVIGLNPNSDPDGDGNTLLYDYQHGIDPTIVMGFWHFDTPDWRGTLGQMPILATNIELASGVISNAVEITNNDGYLFYNLVESNGHKNFDMQNGSVILWFKPYWSSTSLGGTGPGEAPPLVGALVDTNMDGGYWEIYLSGDGNTIFFDSTDYSTDSGFTAPISWESNQWHQIALSYSASNCELYVDGVVVGTNSGISVFPAAQIMLVGNDIEESMVGAIDELETFDRPLSAGEIQGTLNSYAGIPLILTQPQNATNPVGTVTFTVMAIGKKPLTYQWCYNAIPLAGQTNATLTLTDVQESDTGAYSVIVSNSLGVAESVNAYLMFTPPIIISQPQSQTVSPGSNVTFTVSAIGANPLSYQWFYNTNTPLAGATNAALTINAGASSAGTYTVTVSNAIGSVTSSVACLTFSAPEDADGLLARWHFDSVGWLGEEGQIPVVSENITLVPGFIGNGFSLNTNNTSLSELAYNLVEANGNTNLNLQTGTVIFWFQPDWTSVNAGGSGPSEIQYLLFSTPDYSDYWDLHIDYFGNSIAFGDQSSFISPQLTGSILFQSNQWYQIALTYDASGSALYTNGVLVATGGGVTSIPSSSTFMVGSEGDFAAQGTIDELKTFDRPLAASEISSDFMSDSQDPPFMVTQPQNQAVVLGSNAAFTATAEGGAPLLYQWYYNTNTPVPGATSGQLVVNNAQLSEAGNYFLVVTNGFGSVTSAVVTLAIVPGISITNPVDGATFNATGVDVQGTFATAAVEQITVNGVLAFTSSNAFEALDVPLSPGTNVIVATIEDFDGATNTTSITVIGATNADGSTDNPVQLQATPTVGFAPLPVIFTIQTNLPGTLLQVFYDFNGDGIFDLATNTTQPLTYTYTTNGEYFPVVTIQTTAGWFSSSGGWNSTDPNRIQINVKAVPVILSTISITDPVDVKWSADSNLYVLSGSTATITEFDANANVIRSLSGIGSNPSSLDVDAAGNVYVAITGNNQVWKFNPTNTTFAPDTNFGFGGFIGDTNGAAGANSNQFNAPFGVAVSPVTGIISVSDSGNDRIQAYSTNGTFSSSFGSPGGSLGEFNNPEGLAYDSSGILYVADSGNSRIVVARGTGDLVASGTNGTGPLQFSNPANLDVSERGIYVADTGNNRIQCFNPLGEEISELTQSDLRWTISTNLNQPAAVATVDNLTNEMFYVADTGDNRIILYSIAVGDPSPAWTNMVGHISNGDISGATSFFSVASADKYREAFLTIGPANCTSAIGQIGTLTPVYIMNNKAQFYFEQTIEGQTITFPVDFELENGVWKIVEF